MSESLSRILYPFEIARRPTIEPEVLARWSGLRDGQPQDQITLGPRPERSGAPR